MFELTWFCTSFGSWLPDVFCPCLCAAGMLKRWKQLQTCILQKQSGENGVEPIICSLKTASVSLDCPSNVCEMKCLSASKSWARQSDSLWVKIEVVCFLPNKYFEDLTSQQVNERSAEKVREVFTVNASKCGCFSILVFATWQPATSWAEVLKCVLKIRINIE